MSVVGKVLADVILQRPCHLLESGIYLESQSGYRSNCSTVDGIFTVRQLMEKTREHRQNLYIAFIDFMKAFDKVNRTLLYMVLGKLGCPKKFVDMVSALHTGMEAKLLMNGNLSQPVSYNSGVKQGCKLAPTLFRMFAAVLLYLAFKQLNNDCCIHIRFWHVDDIYNLRRLKAKSKTHSVYIREAQ